MTEETGATLISSNSDVVKTSRGDFTVREIVIEDIPLLAKELISLFSALPQDTLEEADGLAVFATLIGKPETLNAIKKILSQLTDSPADSFEKFPVKDLLRLIKKFIELNDLMELRDLFFELRGTAKEKLQKEPT